MATTWKNRVKVATTEKLGSPPKIPGDGKIDGVTLTAGDHVLVKDQADLAENGIYEVQSNPNPGLPSLLLARPNSETVEPEDAVRVSEGNTNPHTEWALRAQGTIVVGTTPLPWVRRDPLFNVLDFGADPSGKAGSWQAFKDWSTAISNAGGGIGLVPAGIYMIDKVADADGTEDFRFEGCKGLWLIGYGATLNLKGDVHLNFDPIHGSDKHMVCPFLIRQCRNVCIEGFEINGNADKLTKDDGVLTGRHCISIASSNHVTIRNMHIHHGWMDGISIRAKDYLVSADGWHACRNVVIENCEVHANFRCNIGVHETRHIRISDCRLYNSPMGIDIEPDFWIGAPSDPEIESFDTHIEPPGASRFTIIENCEIYNNENPLRVYVRYSHVRVQGCFIDNQHNDQQPVVLSVPHCVLLDSEIDTGAGRIDVALTGTDPGNNVFTMERCLIRSNTAMVKGVLTTGGGLFIAPDPSVIPHRIKQALIANNRFINESDQPWFPIDPVSGKREDNGSRFPNLSHGDLMLQLTFRDNYVFIPKEAYHRKGVEMPAVGMHVHLAENNVYDTDLACAQDYFEVLYLPEAGTPPRYGMLVRNERFLSAGDGKSFRPGDNTLHDNTLPFSLGVQSVGSELPPGRTQRVFFATNVPSSGVFQQGDIIFKSDASTGSPMGWVCTKGGEANAPVDPAVFAPMPNL